ncbi:hypothetical protein [Vibrio sp. D431a]|uniref:hypothetical protein n=1 Tax=Vibrio sp. D431a TaxID=2837388 RepID=UPI00255796BE|nr:hypothetical protein [Vibrio sp. D431a]MDK9789815.1 hypothetical protein [Vibrio sp. D431a]
MATFHLNSALNFKANAEDSLNSLSSLITASMPSKGLVESDCQQLYITNLLMHLERAIDSVEESDFSQDVDADDYEIISFTTVHNSDVFTLQNTDAGSEVFLRVVSKEISIDTSEAESLIYDVISTKSHSELGNSEVEVPLYQDGAMLDDVLILRF